MAVRFIEDSILADEHDEDIKVSVREGASKYDTLEMPELAVHIHELRDNNCAVDPRLGARPLAVRPIVRPH